MAVLCVLPAACSRPRFIRKVPGLRVFYRPWASPYLEHPRFSFEIKRSWKGPEPAVGGPIFTEPKGRAAVSVAFHAQGEPGYKPPTAYRQHMREQGAVHDSHILTELLISSRTASRAVYTSYRYHPEYLLGEQVQTRMTDHIMIPDEEGIYVVRYEADRRHFFRFHHVLERMLKTLVLLEPRKKRDADWDFPY